MKKISPKTLLITMSVFLLPLPVLAAPGQCSEALFILDDSGSVSATERSDMTVSVQALADALEIAAPGIKVGVVQYSSKNAGKHYVIETPFVTNPTVLNVSQPGSSDYLPTSIAEMEGDGLFSGSGAFVATDAIFIFTDAGLAFGDTWITGTGIPTTVDASTSFPASTAFWEYSDLSTSLGGIPLSMYRVGLEGGSVSGVAQSTGILSEGNANFQMSTAEIDSFVSSLSTSACGGTGGPAPTSTPVPTLSTWMLGLLSLSLFFVGFRQRIKK